ncbi:MAG: hypothetical protein ACTSXQ_00820 [Alphaproteobacteria bacterium]
MPILKNVKKTDDAGKEYVAVVLLDNKDSEVSTGTEVGVLYGNTTTHGQYKQSAKKEGVDVYAMVFYNGFNPKTFEITNKTRLAQKKLVSTDRYYFGNDALSNINETTNLLGQETYDKQNRLIREDYNENSTNAVYGDRIDYLHEYTADGKTIIGIKDDVRPAKEEEFLYVAKYNAADELLYRRSTAFGDSYIETFDGLNSYRDEDGDVSLVRYLSQSQIESNGARVEEEYIKGDEEDEYIRSTILKYNQEGEVEKEVLFGEEGKNITESGLGANRFYFDYTEEGDLDRITHAEAEGGVVFKNWSTDKPYLSTFTEKKTRKWAKAEDNVTGKNRYEFDAAGRLTHMVAENADNQNRYKVYEINYNAETGDVESADVFWAKTRQVDADGKAIYLDKEMIEEEAPYDPESDFFLEETSWYRRRGVEREWGEEARKQLDFYTYSEILKISEEKTVTAMPVIERELESNRRLTGGPNTLQNTAEGQATAMSTMSTNMATMSISGDSQVDIDGVGNGLDINFEIDYWMTNPYVEGARRVAGGDFCAGADLGELSKEDIAHIVEMHKNVFMQEYCASEDVSVKNLSNTQMKGMFRGGLTGYALGKTFSDTWGMGGAALGLFMENVSNDHSVITTYMPRFSPDGLSKLAPYMVGGEVDWSQVPEHPSYFFKNLLEVDPADVKGSTVYAENVKRLESYLRIDSELRKELPYSVLYALFSKRDPGTGDYAVSTDVLDQIDSERWEYILSNGEEKLKAEFALHEDEDNLVIKNEHEAYGGWILRRNTDGSLWKDADGRAEYVNVWDTEHEQLEYYVMGDASIGFHIEEFGNAFAEVQNVHDSEQLIDNMRYYDDKNVRTGGSPWLTMGDGILDRASAEHWFSPKHTMERDTTDQMQKDVERTMDAIDKIVDYYKGLDEEIPQPIRNNIESFYKQLEINQFYCGKQAEARGLDLADGDPDPNKNYWKYVDPVLHGEHPITHEYVSTFTIDRLYETGTDNYRDHMRGIWTDPDLNCATEEDVMEHRDEEKLNISEIRHAGVYNEGSKSYLAKKIALTNKYNTELAEHQTNLASRWTRAEDEKSIHQEYAEAMSDLHYSYYFDKDGKYEVMSNRTGENLGGGANFQLNEEEMYKTYDLNPEKLAYWLTRPSGTVGPDGKALQSTATKSDVLSAENLQSWIKLCTEDTYTQGTLVYWDVANGAQSSPGELRSGIVDNTPLNTIGSVITREDLAADLRFFYTGVNVENEVTRKGHQVAYLENNKEETQERWKMEYAVYSKLSDMDGDTSDDDNALKEQWLFDNDIHIWTDINGVKHHNNRPYMLPLKNEWVHNPDGSATGVDPADWLAPWGGSNNTYGSIDPANSGARNTTDLGEDHHADDNPPVVTGFKIEHPGMRSISTAWEVESLAGESVEFNHNGHGVLGIPPGHPSEGFYFKSREVNGKITPIPVLDSTGNQVMDRWFNDATKQIEEVPRWERTFSDEQEAYIEHMRGNEYWDEKDAAGNPIGTVDDMFQQIEDWRWSTQCRPAWKNDMGAGTWETGYWDPDPTHLKDSHKIWIDGNYDHEEYAKKFSEFPHFEELALKMAVMDIVDDEIEFLEGLDDYAHIIFDFENSQRWGYARKGKSASDAILDGQYLPLCSVAAAHTNNDILPWGNRGGYLLDIEENESTFPATGEKRIIEMNGVYYIKKDMDENGSYTREDYEQFVKEWYRYRDGFDYDAERATLREIGKNRVRDILGEPRLHADGTEMEEQIERTEAMTHLALPMFQSLSKKAQMTPGLLSAGEQGALEELNRFFKEMLNSNTAENGYEMYGTLKEIHETLNRVEELSGGETVQDIKEDPSHLKDVAENMTGFFNRIGFTIVADLITYIGLSGAVEDDLLIPEGTYIESAAHDADGNISLASPLLLQSGELDDGFRVNGVWNWARAMDGRGTE